jgi:hypothetical protein
MDYKRLYYDLKSNLLLEIKNLRMSGNDTEAQVARSLENIYSRNLELHDKLEKEDHIQLKTDTYTDYIKIPDGTRIPGSATEIVAEAISTFEEMVKKRNIEAD